MPNSEDTRIIESNRSNKIGLPIWAISDRNWTDDFPQENGMYQNNCVVCNKTFFGNKHRIGCFKCFTEMKDNKTEF